MLRFNDRQLSRRYAKHKFRSCYNESADVRIDGNSKERTLRRLNYASDSLGMLDFRSLVCIM